jgi:hypothetical protein
MRKIIYVATVFILFALASGCAAKYLDVRLVYNAFIKDTNEYTAALDKTTDARKATDLTNAYMKKVSDFIKRMDALSEIYPELLKPQLPAELKDLSVGLKQAVEERRAVINKKSESFDDEELWRALSQLR